MGRLLPMVAQSDFANSAFFKEKDGFAGEADPTQPTERVESGELARPRRLIG